jgi:hypothetical protein
MAFKDFKGDDLGDGLDISPYAPGIGDNLYPPKGPDLSYPLDSAGSSIFIRDTDMADAPLDGGITVDGFRRDVGNLYSSTPHRPTRMPFPVYPPHKHNPKLPAYAIYSDELQQKIYFEKAMPTKYKLKTDADGISFDYLSKFEQYDFYVNPELFDTMHQAGKIPGFLEYMQGKFVGSGYSSSNFKMSLANQSNNLASVQENFVHVTSHYNYYESPYEEVIENVSERVLPNLYTYMIFLEEKQKILLSNLDMEQNGSYLALLDNFSTHVTLNNNITTLNAPAFGGDATKLNTSGLIKKTSLSRYLDAWAEAIGKIDFSTESVIQLSSIVNNYKTIVVSEMSLDDVTRYNKLSRNFPMHVEISFTTDPNTQFFKMLKDTQMSTTLLSWLKNDAPATQENYAIVTGTGTSAAHPRLVYDFEQFLNQVVEGNLSQAEFPENYVFFGDLFNQAAMIYSGNSIFSQLSAAALRSKVESFIKNKTKTYLQILNEGMSYNETFCYEIEKLGGTPVSKYISDLGVSYAEDTIQTFFLPNDDKKIINFIDTQVKYNTSYYYRIWKWQIVVSTDYWTYFDSAINDAYNSDAGSLDPLAQDTQPYGQHPWTGWTGAGEKYEQFKTHYYDPTSGQTVVRAKIKTSPNVKLVRVPYYNVAEPDYTQASDTIVLDAPPLSPEIEIVPIIDEPNNLLINIKDTLGSVKTFAKVIDTAATIGGAGGFQISPDSAAFLAILNQQVKNELNLSPEEMSNVTLENNKIFFKSDDMASSFEVYQTAIKPLTYEDFSGNLIDTPSGPNNVVKLELAFNQKYYFTFRTVDIHGKVSNPTPVYQVEIRENSGAVYPIIKILDLEEEAKKLEAQKIQEVVAKSGKMFLYLKPTHDQTDLLSNLSDEAETATELLPIALGDVEGESVFSKKFKIRIKSKKTGKVIDINMNFDNLMQNSYISQEDGFGD